MEVNVNVGAGVNVDVGRGVRVGVTSADNAAEVSVAAWFADSAVCAMMVGRNSGGIAVGMALGVGEAHPARSPRREAMKKRRFMNPQRNVPQVLHKEVCKMQPAGRFA